MENYKDQNEKQWSRYECCSCAVQFWLPLVAPEGDAYEEDVAYQGKSEVLSKKNAHAIVRGYWNARQFLSDFSKKGAAPKKLLDVGCGTGEFAFVAGELGYQVEGVDFNAGAVALARARFGLRDVFVADVYAFLEDKREAYDVITAFEVIEHFPDPGRFLELARGALTVGGVLVLSTPNRDRYWGRINARSESWDFPYQHLSRWSVRSLRNFAEDRGFGAVRMREELPTDWFVERLRSAAGMFLGKPRADDRRSASERTRSRLGFSRYERLKRAVLAVCEVPAAIMHFIFRFKGVHLYGVFIKDRTADYGPVVRWLRSPARKPIVLSMSRWIGPLRVRLLAFKGYFAGIFSRYDLYAYLFKGAKSRTKEQRLLLAYYLQREATLAAIKQFVRADGSVEFCGRPFFPCEGNYWEMMMLFDSTVTKDPYRAEQFLKEDSVVIDAGANTGVFTVLAATLAPRGRVYAFEPIQRTFAALMRNTERLRKENRVECHQEFLAEKDGEKVMRAALSGFTGSLAEDSPFVPHQDTFDFDIVERVRTIRIDDFVKEKHIKRLDFIKIDTEGYERFVLQGAHETIRRFKPVIAMSAYHNPDDKEVLLAFVKSACPEYVVELSQGTEEDFICYVP
ncbi:MAG: FkbM family methyltransferase [Minisyncoccia bacterium]|jgi:FkbM family methyltransferase